MDRSAVASAAADLLERSPRPPALVGFDGFIDSIIDLVDVRRDAGSYTRIPTIAAFAARCAAAAGKSTGIERVIRERRFGGNGPLMAAALARLGLPTTYIGAVGEEGGDDQDSANIHPAYEPFAALCRRVIPTGPPSATDALEFDDGKLMLNETAAVQRVTWARLIQVLGLPELRRTFAESTLIGIVNWSLLSGMTGIWRGLLADILPHLPRAPRHFFIDLASPSRRTDEQLREALGLLADLHAAGLRTTLGLNEPESARVAAVLGSPASPVHLRAAMNLDCIVVHHHRGATAADATGPAAFTGPYTAKPRLLTGAGDHFNAGFALARCLGAPLDQALAAGCAVSGAYVRDAAPPDTARVVGFLRTLPEPEA